MGVQTFEVCTQMGCCVACLKYCPQEVILENYKGDKVLSLAAFKKLIRTVPSDRMLVFSGVSEPFQNKNCTNMILYAHSCGYKIRVYTTLTGLELYDAMRLLEIPFDRFTLHLPDAEGVAKIPITDNYLNCLAVILTHVHNIEFMNMGKSFVSFKHEDYFRGLPVKRKSYRPYCASLESPNYIMQPNGEVFFCCQTKGLVGKIGSLYENTYQELTEPFKFKRHADEMRKTVCHFCHFSEPFWWFHLQRMKSKLLGDTKLKERLL